MIKADQIIVKISNDLVLTGSNDSNSQMGIILDIRHLNCIWKNEP